MYGCNHLSLVAIVCYDVGIFKMMNDANSCVLAEEKPKPCSF